MRISRLAAAAAAKSLQSCPTLCDPIDGSPPGLAVPGILQARTLEWVAISFSNAWKWKVKVKLLSRVWLLTTANTLNSLFPLFWSFIPQIILFTVRHSNFFSSWILSLLPLSNTPSSSFNNCLYARYCDIYTLVMNFNCEFTSYFRHLKLSKLKVNQVNTGIICKQLKRMARVFWNISKK